MSNLHFTASIDAAKFNKTLEDIEKRIRGIQESANTSQPWFSAAKIIEASEVIGVLKEVAGSIIKVRAEFQQLEVSFGAMLKSKAEANAMMQDVVQMAAQSPFEFGAIADGAKQLIIFGANAQTATNDLKMLGDIAVGTGMPINDLAAAYGAMRKEGEASKDQLEELAGKGIPIYAELGKILKISTDDVKYFADAGKVGFNEMQQAFISLTSNGGMFEGLMQQQSETLQGSLTQLSNSFSNMFNALLEDQDGFLASALSVTADVINNYEAIADVLKIVIATYGAYRAAILLVVATQKLAAAATFVQEYFQMAKACGVATAHMIAFNGAVAANPYVLAATALVALIGYIAVYKDELSDAEKAQQKLNDVKQQTDKELTGEIAKTQVLTAQIKNETLSREERNKALQQLIALSPEHLSSLTLENASTAAGTQAINRYIEAKRKQLELKNLEKELDESMQRQLDAKNLKNEMPWYQKMLYGAVYGANAGAKIAEGTIKDNAEIVKSEEAIQKGILDKIAATTKDASATAKANKEKHEGAKKTIEDYDKEIALNENLRKANSTNRKEAIKYEHEINKLKRERAALTGENEIKEPFGSLAYWQAISKKAGEVLAKLNPLDKTKQADIAKLQSQKLEADLKAEEASKLIAVKTSEQIFEEKRKQYEQYQQWVAMKGKASADKEYADLLQSGNSYQEYIGSQINNLEVKVSTGTATDKDREALIKLQKEDQRIFEQGLAEKKTQYELYNRWVTFAGKEAADAQFKDLLQSGASYEQYIEGKIGGIKAKQTSGTASTTDLENLVAYQFTLESVTQSFEKYKQQITAAGEKTGTMTEKLALLKEEQGKIGTSDPQKAGFIAEQIVETEKKRKALLDDFLNEFNLYEQKRVEIQSKYNNLRAELDAQYADKKSEAYLNALARINEQEKEALEKFDTDAVLKNSKGYQELQKIVFGSEDAVLTARIEQTKRALQDLEKQGVQTTEEYKKLQQQLLSHQENLLGNQVSYFKNLANIFGKIKSEGKGAGGVISSIAKQLSAVAGYADSALALVKLIKQRDLATDETAKALTQQQINGDIYTMALQATVNIVNKIIEIDEHNKAKRKEYYQMVINRQHEYNKLLNDEIRLKSEEGLFDPGINSKINDALKAQSNAIESFNLEFKKLVDSGKAIDGTMKKFKSAEYRQNWWKMTIFEGFKDVDKLVPLFEKHKKLYDASTGGINGFNLELAKTLVATKAVDEATAQQLQRVIDWVEKYNEAQEQINKSLIELTGQIGQNLKNSLVNAFKSGESAAKAFGDTVSAVVENIIVELLYAETIKPIIDQMGQAFKDSYKRDADGNLIGDGNIRDDIQRYSTPLLNASQDFTNGLKDLKKEVFDSMNIEILKQTDAHENTLSGSIKSITEETAGVLAGQMNAIRVTQATNLEVNRSQLLALNKIATNSEFLQHLEILKSIDKKLGASSGLRDIGVQDL